ncbi:hypothetical protein EDC90_101723 [Martelella mediterranea]|uniref:Uncharacterized protein n=1 Tax=Martelella mediterranea TaxID=293089 RepID=A0A4R3NNZ4_9HYPH|nr:hypothetical protein EDC90_101723 [Martelella mediterranea]
MRDQRSQVTGSNRPKRRSARHQKKRFPDSRAALLVSCFARQERIMGNNVSASGTAGRASARADREQPDPPRVPFRSASRPSDTRFPALEARGRRTEPNIYSELPSAATTSSASSATQPSSSRVYEAAMPTPRHLPTTMEPRRNPPKPPLPPRGTATESAPPPRPPRNHATATSAPPLPPRGTAAESAPPPRPPR